MKGIIKALVICTIGAIATYAWATVNMDVVGIAIAVTVTLAFIGASYLLLKGKW